MGCVGWADDPEIIKMKRLHLGCGKRAIKGWFHMDAEPHPHIDKQGDISNLGFIESDTVDTIYACHVLEYFKNPELVLEEWRRVLKPGGELWIAVPDFDGLHEYYKRNRDIDEILGPLFGHWGDIQHASVYNSKSLHRLLKYCGFKDYKMVPKFDHGIDDYSQAHLPHDPEAIKTGEFRCGSIPISLNVICSK